jgi:hypothetical protein
MTGPYDEEPVSAGCCGEPPIRRRSLDVKGRRRETALHETRDADEREKAMTRRHLVFGDRTVRSSGDEIGDTPTRNVKGVRETEPP